MPDFFISWNIIQTDGSPNAKKKLTSLMVCCYTGGLGGMPIVSVYLQPNSPN